MTAKYLVMVFVAATLCAALPAKAELTQVDNIVVAFHGGFYPTSLPRHKPVPVKVHITGSVKSTLADAPLPHLERITLAFRSPGGARGQLSGEGLATCRKHTVQPSVEKEARKLCGDALVGSGDAILQVRYPGQRSFLNKVKILFFNAPQRHGHSRIFAQAYSKMPPASFIVPVSLSRQKGPFGTTVTSVIPHNLRSSIFFKHFDMTLARTYFFHGKRRSLLSAACSAPAGFPGATFPLLQITYGFSSGRSITTTIVRSCSVQE
jgi:hypothetical protein